MTALQGYSGVAEIVKVPLGIAASAGGDAAGPSTEPIEGGRDFLENMSEAKTLDLELFVEKYLRLDHDKKDPQYFLFKTPLYTHYVSACKKEQCIPLKNQQFARAVKGLLEDNFKGGGSHRDQHYVGIGLVFA